MLAGLTIQTLAERAGLSVPFLSDLERGRKEPSLATLRKLASGLKLSVTELLRDEPNVSVASIGKRELLARIEPFLAEEYAPEDALRILACVAAAANPEIVGLRLWESQDVGETD